MLRWISLLITLLAGLTLAAPSQAATVFAYSQSDNTYGWCAGYQLSYSRSCAVDQCQQAGGTQCQEIILCDGGYGAAAFAEGDTGGFGAVCDFPNADGARFGALIACMNASNALCYTSTAFNSNGREQSQGSNLEFDNTLLGQMALQVAQFDTGLADGAMGPKTRAAIREFQTRIGLQPTGQLDHDLVMLMINANVSTSSFIQQMRDQLLANFADFYNVMYGYAGAPLASRSYHDELAGYDATTQRRILATYLTLADTKCSIPAIDVAMIDVDVWTVDCDEGVWTVVLNDDGTSMIMSGDVNVTDVPDDGGTRSPGPGPTPAPSTGGKDKTAPVTKQK